MPATASGVNYSWFRAQIDKQEMSQNEFGERIGLNQAATSMTLRGKRQLKINEAVDIAKLFNVPIEEVLRHVGLDVPAKLTEPSGKVLVTGWIGDHGVIHFETPAGPNRVPAPVSGVKDVTALRVRSDDPMDGWLIFFTPSKTKEIPPEAIGQLCVVETDSGDWLLRNVKRGYEPGYNSISSWRAERTDNVKLRSAAPVLWMRQ